MDMTLNSKTSFLIGIALLVMLLASCFEILMVNQPEVVTVGEEFTVTIDAKLTGKDGSTLIFGFLAPRSWRAADFTSVSFESTLGGSTMSLIDPNEVEATNSQLWQDALNERVGFGGNYGEVQWTIFKADTDLDPAGVSEDNPATGTITMRTRAGETNQIAQLGYFIGEGFWGFLNENTNSEYVFAETCIEVMGASGQAQNLCGPAPRRLINLETYTFDDLLTITFDAQEDTTTLIGANEVFACLTAIQTSGSSEICDRSEVTKMRMLSPDVWEITLWPPSFFNVNEPISEILVNFQDASGSTIVRDVSGNDFQILEKCF